MSLSQKGLLLFLSFKGYYGTAIVYWIHRHRNVNTCPCHPKRWRKSSHFYVDTVDMNVFDTQICTRKRHPAGIANVTDSRIPFSSKHIQYSQRDVYILRAHARKKKGLSSTQNPRKTLAHSSQNPRLFHAMSTFIPRKKRVSCVRYKQSHAFHVHYGKEAWKGLRDMREKDYSFVLFKRVKLLKFCDQINV